MLSKPSAFERILWQGSTTQFLHFIRLIRRSAVYNCLLYRDWADYGEPILLSVMTIPMFCGDRARPAVKIRANTARNGKDSPRDTHPFEAVEVRNDSVALLLADQRMPHMDGGHSAGSNTDLPRGEARIAYSLRGHECRDRRHQSSQHQLLFSEAVGSSRGASIPTIG